MNLCSAILSKFLDKYIQKVDKNQLNGSLLKGHIELSNISFTKNFLTSFGIPLLINESHAELIKVDFPMKSIKNTSAYFKMTNVEIFTTIEWSAMNQVSINSIADLIQLIQDEKKAIKADKRKAWNSWIEKIIDNASIDIQNVRLHIEFTNWDKKTSIITIFFESLMMNTVNSKDEIITLNKKPEILIKRIKLSSFSIALHTNKETIQLNKIEYNILNKSSFTFKMIHNRNKTSISNSFILDFDPIFFSITQEQYFALNHLFNDFSKSKIRQKFEICMKPSDENLNKSYFIEMWHYLNRCAKKIRHPHKFSPKTAIKFLKLRHEYSKNFISKKINQKMFVNKSIKNYGEDLTFLLIQYSSILICREERKIQLDEKEIDTISKDDITFFSKDSIRFELNIQGICIEMKSFALLSINNIKCLYEKNGENFDFDLNVQNCFVDEFNPSNKIIQTIKNENNFIQFNFHSKDDTAVFIVSKIKVDIQSSFLKKFCHFFVNNNNNNQVQTLKNKDKVVKSSPINQYLIMLNPKTFIKFKILFKGISIGYKTSEGDDQHSFNCEINKIEMQNFSDLSKTNFLNIILIMIFDQIKVDDLIMSENFSLKSSTTGTIDKYYFLNDINTNLDILNAKFCFDSKIVDKVSTILESVTKNTQRNSTKTYSSHKINANCSRISISIDTGVNHLILSISEIGLNPSIEFRNICIIEQDKEPKINIPSLCFDKWPIIETNLINVKLNSYEFFDLFDEVDWIITQVTKLTNSFMTDTEENSDNFQLNAYLIDYKMGDRANSMKFNDCSLIIDENFNIKVESLSLFDSENKQFLFCDNSINFVMKTSDEKNVISVKFPNLKMNFLWNETNQIIEYFQDSRNLIEQNVNETNNKNSNESSKIYQVIVFIDKSLIDIENSFTVLLDELKFDYLIAEKSSLSFILKKIDIDNLLEVNDFNFNINDFIYDISISSINANLSQTKAAKISNLSFIPNILRIFENKEKEETKNNTDSQFDMNLYITNFTFIESSTKLTLTIPTIKVTLNSYYSIGAIQIPSINFEKLIFNNIEIIMLFNSIDYKYENIDSVFLLERKKLLNESELHLTNLNIQLNSIEFDYAHYFVMRIFNAYKIYSKYAFLGSKDEKEGEFNCPITAKINQIIIKEHNLSDSISLFGLFYEQEQNSIEFKCNSIECFRLIEMIEELNETDFFVLQKNDSNTNLKINPINIYLNINTIKTLSYIYESFSSLIKTNFYEKKQNKIEKNLEKNESSKGCFNIDLTGIHIHFSFEDDPLFKEHALITSFNLQIEINDNLYKLLNINSLNMFFKNYKKKMEFLPLIKDASILLKIHNNDQMNSFDFSLFELELGTININLSALDIFELQMIIDNIKKSYISLFNPKTYSIPDVSKKEKKILTIKECKIKLNPISISLCEENRSSSLYNQILSLYIETQSTNLTLHQEIQSFSIDLLFTIMHMNSLLGKLEIFMQPTSLNINFSRKESYTANFELFIRKDIEFNLTKSSIGTIMKFVRKFKNKDLVLILKNESNINYKSNYWFTNNLDNELTINYTVNGELRQQFAAPNDHLPLCEYEEDQLITFSLNDFKGSFYPKNILFPIYFNNISVSTIFDKNYIKSIEFNSPLSIQNKLDFRIFIFIKSDKQFIHYATLLPKAKYPLSFEEKQYFIVGDFETISFDKSKKKWKKKKKNLNDEKIPQLDQNNLPEIFSLSLNKSPKIIKIQNTNNKKSITFLLNVHNDYRTNTRVYEINPTFFIKNLLSYPIFAKIFNVNNNNEEDCMFLDIQEKRQINFFNHDNQSFSVSLSIDIYKFEKPTLVKLDKENEIFAGNNYTAIQVQKSLNEYQKQVVIFSPCVIFNKSTTTINFSSSFDQKERKINPNDFTFYGLDAYSKSENSMKIDISIQNSEKKCKALDCMRLNSNCLTIYLQRINNPKLFYPLNCSITLGDFPMNVTHVVTFTSYLYVINNLPFDFSLIPVTSNKVESINSNYNNIEPLLNQIESDSQFLLNDCFYVVPCLKENSSNNKENCVLINCVPKNAMFLFSVSAYPNNPIIQLNGINRTIFMMKNRKDIFYIELNIYEDKSTLYAHFQIPTFPVPLTINNSLKIPVFVYQNIKPNKNKLMIHPDSSSLFAFTQPFINNKELRIEIQKDEKNVVEFLFSMEEQLSPLISIENNLIISTTIISKNNSKMIQIRYNDESLVYQNNFRFSLSIHSLLFSLKNDLSEIALFSLKNVSTEACQDDRNTFLNLSIESIQIDNQRTTAENSVCLVGTGKNLLQKEEEENCQFFNLLSIFPRGVPIFSAINFMSIQIQPLFIIADPSIIFNLTAFVKNVMKKSMADEKSDGSMIIEPSFKSVNVNKTLIAYFEICPINVFIQIPTEKTNESFLKSAAMKFLNMISLSKFSISTPKLFASEFNNNISYLFELYRNYYGNEIMNQVSKNSVIKMVASSLIRFKKLKFVPLDSNVKIDDQVFCDNRKPIFNFFNEIELNDLLNQTDFYFNQTPDVIQQLIKNDSSYLEISRENQSNSGQTENRLVIGIKNEQNVSCYSSSYIDLIKLIQSNEIKRVRIPIISPIYSSFDDSIKSELENELETQNQPETEPKNIDKSQNQPEIETKNQDESQNQSENENKSKGESQNQPETEPKNKDESQNQPENKSTSQDESQNQSETEPKNKDESQSQAEIETQNENKIETSNSMKTESQDEIEFENINENESENANENGSQENEPKDTNNKSILKKLNPAEIYLKIQTEMLNDKKLENQNIKFVVESKTGDLVYCVTNEIILIFTIQDENIQISQKVELNKFNSVSTSGKTVSLISDDKKVNQIDIEFNREEDANTLVSFINTQQKMISFFGHVLSLT